MGYLETSVPAVNGSETVDLDGDGDLDIYYSLQNPYSDGELVWLLNVDGQAHFERRTIPGFRGRSQRVQSNDIDHDGDVDLWVQIGTSVHWLENKGSAGFVVHDISSTFDGPIVLIDLDGDDQPELLTLNPSTGNWSRSVIDPAGTVIRQSGFLAGGEVAQALGDLNRDGRIDIVGNLGWYEQTANDHQFTTHRYPTELKSDRTIVADVNADGRLEIIVADHALTSNKRVTRLHWMEIGDDGLLTPHQIAEIETPRLSGGVLVDMRAIDLDGDGDEDLLVEFTNRNEWWENTNAVGEFSSRGANALPPIKPQQLADLDGDGDLDGVRAYNGLLEWYERLDNGGYVAHRIASTLGSRLAAAADMDGDGDLDVVSAGDSSVYWHENIAGQGIATGVGHLVATGKQIYTIQIADFNTDTLNDRLVSDGL